MRVVIGPWMEKSTMIKFISIMIAEHFRNDRYILRIGPTGTSAFAEDGATINSMLRFYINQRSTPLESNLFKKFIKCPVICKIYHCCWSLNNGEKNVVLDGPKVETSILEARTFWKVLCDFYWWLQSYSSCRLHANLRSKLVPMWSTYFLCHHRYCHYNIVIDAGRKWLWSNNFQKSTAYLYLWEYRCEQMDYFKESIRLNLSRFKLNDMGWSTAFFFNNKSTFDINKKILKYLQSPICEIVCLS